MASIPRNCRGQVTQREIDGLVLPDGKIQEDFWHPDMGGFGVRVGKKGSVYVAKGSVKVGTRKRPRRITIGRTDLIGLADALAKGREILGMMAQGIDPKEVAAAEEGRIATLRDMIARAESGKGDGYGNGVRKYMADLLDVRLADIDAGRIEVEYRRIIQEVKARKHGPSVRSTAPGVATANAVLRGLSAMWNYVGILEGERHGIPPNPVGNLAKVKAVRKTPVKKDRIESAKLGDFWRVLVRDDFVVGRDAVAVMLLTGLRRQSACAMKVSEWDSDGQILTFAEGRLKGKTGEVSIPVSKEVAAILDRRTDKAVNGWMFPSSGKAGYLAEPRSVLDRLMKKIGGQCNIHGLRRTFSSEASFAMFEPQRKQLMVHAMSGVTQEVYTEVTVEDLRASAQSVTNRLLGYCGDDSVISALIDGRVVDGIELGERRAEVLHEVKVGMIEAAADPDNVRAVEAVVFGGGGRLKVDS